MTLLTKVLIANRGEIAVRIIRTCRELGVTSVVLCSEPDRGAFHTRLADEVIYIPGATAAESYLNIDAVIAAMRESGAEAVHPGYGFLSENATAAQAIVDAGGIWIGPPSSAIAAMGSKLSARAIARAAGVPTVPGTSEPVTTAESIVAFASDAGWPVAIKASFGGGGRGMKVVHRAEDAAEALASATREAVASFANGECYVERYLEWPRHVEVQVLADDHGTVLTVGERDCSVQRRHQKLIEESPAPNLSDDVKAKMAEAAVQLCQAVGYRNAGTVEMIYSDQEFFFLEMNTRLQVEHSVTEMVTGLDLVAEQLRIASGLPISVSQHDIAVRGHAIEVRINAEDPSGGRFTPSPGRLASLHVPGGNGVRWDGGYEAGDLVSPFYDNLIGKLIVWGPDRETARLRTIGALRELSVTGVSTTIAADLQILEHEDFAAVRHATRWLEQQLSFPDASTADAMERTSTDVEAGSQRRSEVEVNGRTYSVPRHDTPTSSAGAVTVTHTGPPATQRGNRVSQARATGRLLAPMQGTVIKVNVAIGDDVCAGDVLVVLEAMKMESPLLADMDGTVTELAVTAGSLVGPGDVLVVVR